MLVNILVCPSHLVHQLTRQPHPPILLQNRQTSYMSTLFIPPREEHIPQIPSAHLTSYRRIDLAEDVTDDVGSLPGGGLGGGGVVDALGDEGEGGPRF